MIIGNKNFDFNKRTYVMGILNITPDSFSDGGFFMDVDLAMAHAREMILEGVDIIDIGGESTRPGHVPVSVEEEIERVVPVIEAIRAQWDIPISIDTSKAAVARAALTAGASLVNDVWGFKKDPDIAKVTAEFGVPCCLMHNRDNKEYTNLIEDMIEDLNESIAIALSAGIEKDDIILDPGVGFAKTLEHNCTVMKSLKRFTALGYPVLLATSRKSMINAFLDLPPEERVEGTIATTVMGIMQGCHMVRVHDVKENVKACRVTDGIIRVGD